MADRLRVKEDDEGFRIGWFSEESGEFGLMVGQYHLWHGPGPYPMVSSLEDQTTNEVRVVENCARYHGADKDPQGYFWSCKERALLALGLLQTALDNLYRKGPTYEWEKQALAAGWTPPKGKP